MDTSKPTDRLSFAEARDADCLQNRIARGTTLYGTTAANKNAHAVALGKMTSPEKAASSAKNGEKGGRPKGS